MYIRVYSAPVSTFLWQQIFIEFLISWLNDIHEIQEKWCTTNNNEFTIIKIVGLAYSVITSLNISIISLWQDLLVEETGSTQRTHKCCIEYTSPRSRFELTLFVILATKSLCSFSFLYLGLTLLYASYISYYNFSGNNFSISNNERNISHLKTCSCDTRPLPFRRGTDLPEICRLVVVLDSNVGVAITR